MHTRYSMATFVVGFVVAAPVNGLGQDGAPAAEIFVGGTKLWEQTGGGAYHNHGLELALTGNFNRFAGLELNLAKFQNTPLNPPASGDYFRFLMGPHFAYNANSRLSPFGHSLLGLTHGRQNILPPYRPGVFAYTAQGQTAFTTGIGGGVDIKLFRFLWLRPIQADYVHAFFPGAPENNLQLSYGLTLRFGGATKW